LVLTHTYIRLLEETNKQLREEAQQLRSQKFDLVDTLGADEPPAGLDANARLWWNLAHAWKMSFTLMHDALSYRDYGIVLTENNSKLFDKLLELEGLFHASLYFKLCARDGCTNTVSCKEQPYRFHKCECKGCQYRRRMQNARNDLHEAANRTNAKEKVYKYCSQQCADAQRSRDYRRRKAEKAVKEI
jgi:hypothetical protein